MKKGLRFGFNKTLVGAFALFLSLLGSDSTMAQACVEITGSDTENGGNSLGQRFMHPASGCNNVLDSVAFMVGVSNVVSDATFSLHQTDPNGTEVFSLVGVTLPVTPASPTRIVIDLTTVPEPLRTLTPGTNYGLLLTITMGTDLVLHASFSNPFEGEAFVNGSNNGFQDLYFQTFTSEGAPDPLCIEQTTEDITKAGIGQNFLFPSNGCGDIIDSIVVKVATTNTTSTSNNFHFHSTEFPDIPQNTIFTMDLTGIPVSPSVDAEYTIDFSSIPLPLRRLTPGDKYGFVFDSRNIQLRESSTDQYPDYGSYIYIDEMGRYVQGPPDESADMYFKVYTSTEISYAPEFSSIADQTFACGNRTDTLSFTVTDANGDSVFVSAASSNTTLVPLDSIVFSLERGLGNNADTNRTVVVKTTSGTGSSTISVYAEDANGERDTLSFTVTKNSPQDQDGDGVNECMDCDDLEANTFPGAPEVCDGKDNDCDGVIPSDEIDADGDGVLGCAGDCDDGDGLTYPGAPELCDGKDNDCDGVVDEGVAPNAIAKDTTFYLGLSGMVTLDSADLNNGSSGCPIDSIVLSKSSFSCEDTDTNAIEMYVWSKGNSDTTTVNVVVLDTLAPEFNPPPPGVDTVRYSETFTQGVGYCEGTPQVDNWECFRGKLDTNKIYSQVRLYGTENPTGVVCTDSTVVNGLARAMFLGGNYGPVSANGLKWYVQSNYCFTGCTSGTTGTEFVVMNTDPTGCICYGPVLNPSAMCIRPAISNENWGGLGDTTCFSPTQTMTLEFILYSGYSGLTTCEPVEAETGIDSLIYLDASGNGTVDTSGVNVADNCGVDTIYFSKYNYTCLDLGSASVTMYAEDASGNKDSISQSITVLDTLAPNALGKDTTLYLNASGEASLDSNSLNDGSTDNCSIDSIGLNMTSFSCSDLGDTTLIMTVRDISGNTDTAHVVVTVEDTLAPSALGKDTTLYLNASGEASLDSNSLNDGSTDNCSIDSIGLNMTSFSCSDLGDTTLILTVRDNSGNTDTAHVVVTVEDTTSPNIVVKGTTINLDSNGIASLDSNSIGDGTTDNCGLDSIGLSKYDFDCDDIGNNKLLFTALDESGNSSSDSVIIVVADYMKPNARAKDTVLYIPWNGGLVSLDSSSLENGTWDNCGVRSVGLDIYDFNCEDLGENHVVFTAYDQFGNWDTNHVLVTVRDTNAPMVYCQDVTLYVDEHGHAYLDSNGLDEGGKYGSSDNCGITDFAVSKSHFGYDDLGENTVWMYAMDESHNVDSCSATVTVLDTFVTAVCQDIRIQLVEGSFTIDSNALDGGSYASSGIASVQAHWTEFACWNLGANQVGMTATANNGSQQDCYAEVVVVPEVMVSHISCAGQQDGSIWVDCPNDLVKAAQTIEHPDPIKYSVDGQNYFAKQTFDNLPAGWYEVRMRANNRIFIVDTVIIESPAALGISTSSSEALCHDDALWLSATANGGTAPYQYSIDAGEIWQSEGLFEGLNPGSYTVTAMDDRGCLTSSDAVSLNLPTALATSWETSPVSCYGWHDGTISGLASGGTPPYQFRINGEEWVSHSNYVDMVAGTYYIDTKDHNGCMVSDTIVITEPTALSMSLDTLGTVACGNDADYIFGVSTQGGTAPYQYYINGDSVSEIDYESLGAGSYVFSVSDANGCSFTMDAVEKTSVNSFSAQAFKTSKVLCYEGTEGTLSIQAQGGQSPYMYSYDGGFHYYPDSAVATGLGAGNYHLMVMDANGCTINLGTFTFTEPAALAMNINIINHISCAGANDGRVQSVATGGVQPYRYSYDGGQTYVFANPAGQNFGPGEHVVYLQDANGCMFASAPFTITEPSALMADYLEIEHNNCAGESQGSISLFAGGGTPPYTWYLNGEPTSSLQVGGLSAGNYSSTLVDANGCSFDLGEVEITSPAALTLSVSQTTGIACEGESTAEITALATGGTGNYSYSLNGEAFQSEASFENLSSGLYTVAVKDANGCQMSNSIFIDQPQRLSLSATASPATCLGQNSGSIEALAQGGSGGYSYSLDGINFQSSGLFENLSPGNYSLLAKDAQGCQSETLSIVVDELEGIALSLESVGQIDCFGGNTGSFSFNQSGGTAPYSYLLNGSAISPVQGQVTGLSAGTYVLEVLDANNCSQSLQVSLSQPTAISIDSVASTQPSCVQGGSLQLWVSGGEAPYTYVLNGSTQQMHGTFNNLLAGSYVVSITDANGCSVQSVSFEMEAPEQVSITSVAVNPIDCHGASTSISVSAVGTDLSYSLNNIDYQSSNSFSGLKAGNHVVYVKNGGQCMVSQSISISQPEQLVLAAEELISIYCYGDMALVNVSAMGGTAGYEYSVDGVNYGAASEFELPAGVQTIYGKDANGCISSTVITISQPTALLVGAETEDEIAGNDGSITITASGGEAPYFYGFWDHQLDSLVLGSQTTNNLSTGDYTVGVLDANDCWDTVTVTVGTQVSLMEEERLSIEVYPNPTAGRVMLDITGNTQVTKLELYNEIGSLMYQKVGEIGKQEVLDLTHYAKGMYYIRIHHSQGVETKTVILQ